MRSIGLICQGHTPQRQLSDLRSSKKNKNHRFWIVLLHLDELLDAFALVFGWFCSIWIGLWVVLRWFLDGFGQFLWFWMVSGLRKSFFHWREHIPAKDAWGKQKHLTHQTPLPALGRPFRKKLTSPGLLNDQKQLANPLERPRRP